MFTLPLKKVGVRLVPRSPSHHASEFASCRSQASVATWPKLQRELEKDVEVDYSASSGGGGSSWACGMGLACDEGC